MPRIESGGGGFLAAFLSPKGRVMYDVFIHPTNTNKYDADPSFLIECDARALPDLHKHIARFVLRSKVKMVGVTESYDVYSVLDAPTEETSNLDSAAVMERLVKMNASIGSLDNRASNLMGYRAVVPKGHAQPETIDFNKIPTQAIPPQSELFPAKTDVGKTPTASASSARPVRASGRTGSNVGNIGLALVKLESVADGQTFDVMDREGANVRAKAFFPSWWPKPVEEKQGLE
ncbi:ccr4 associated factor [Podila horticola]|nr:ccr4 associated factor [Podila horticola]